MRLYEKGLRELLVAAQRVLHSPGVSKDHTLSFPSEHRISEDCPYCRLSRAIRKLIEQLPVTAEDQG